MIERKMHGLRANKEEHENRPVFFKAESAKNKILPSTCNRMIPDVIGDQQLASWFGLMDIRVSQNMTTCK